MDQLTFANTASLLKANGYAPAPIGDGGKPLGPFAVLQIAYAKYTTNDDLPPAVLAAVPAARNAQDPVQDHRSTWLATLTLNVRDALVKEVDAIVAKYIGKGTRCPVRVGDDGSTRVFRLAGDLFSVMATYDNDTARIESAAAWVPVNGTWVDGISLVDVMRDELPELDHERAQRLIGELNALLDAHTPPVVPPAPYVAQPILQPGQRMLYGNTRAMDELRANGFRPLPVRWGQDDIERNGYSDFMGNWHYNVPLDDHGVGIDLGRGFAELKQAGATFRHDVDEAIRSLGPCLVRTVRGEQNPPNVVYIFRCENGKDEFVATPSVGVQVRRAGLLVLSGADTYGREYQWNRDLLTVRPSELPLLEPHDARRLHAVLEPLPSIVDYRRKRA